MEAAAQDAMLAVKPIHAALALLIIVLVAGVIALAIRQSARKAAAKSSLETSYTSTPKDMVGLTMEVNGEQFMLMPAGASAARVEGTKLPATGREDVSSLLIAPSGRARNSGVKEEVDYRPVDAVEWAIDVEFAGDAVLDAGAILRVFDNAWSESHARPVLYGWSPEINHWTYLVSADAPKKFSKLALGWSLYDPLADGPAERSTSTLKAWQQSVEKLASKLGTARVRINRSAEDAAQLSEKLGALVRTCNQEVAIFLVAPSDRRFEGRDIWDVMHCLGLQWGDMDLFHWRNESDRGDDFYISVSTSTAPGYFLPEEIAAGRVHIDDLVFSYSIPRSRDPSTVFDSMMNAVEYAQRRLGGQIQGSDGHPIDEESVRLEIRAIVERMKAAGFAPGEDSTLRLF